MDEKLAKAVEIFKKYGWENVTAENVLELSIGTREEQKTALEGLKSGEWSESIQEYGIRSYREFFNPDFKVKLALFAVRVGVTAARASKILYFYNNTYEEACIKLLEHKGVKFVSVFFARMDYWGVMYRQPNLFLYFISKMNLPVPQNENYLLEWTYSVAESLKLENPYLSADKRDKTDLDIFKESFAEHIRTGVALNIYASGTNGFANVTAAGAKQGLIPREEAYELMFSALDSTVRPNMRAAWVSALEMLEIPNEEYINRIQSLIPILSTGDNAVVSKIAPILIEHSPLEFLTEVLIASFSCNTKKAKKIILKAAMQREKPPNAEALSSCLSVFAADADKTIASLSKKLIERWAINTEEFEEEIMGLWKETPPVWEVPDFEVGDVSPEILTELAAEILARPVAFFKCFVTDILIERFFAAINIVALKDKQKARDALRGLSTGDSYFILYIVAAWIDGTHNEPDALNYEYPIHSPIVARNLTVSFKFGEIPCLLSTPSKIDLTITVSDLISRLNLYQEKNIDALEADLFLALTRLDIKTEKLKHREQLKNIKILIRLHSGEPVKILRIQTVTAGQAVINYLENPLIEPKIYLEKSNNCYLFSKIKERRSFVGFPRRIYDDNESEYFSIFPWMGDGVLHDLCWDPHNKQHDMGILMRQVARRGVPFSPAVAINFLAVMRSLSPQAAADATLAIQEAWERGLLRPLVPDIKYLDWTTKPPSHLAALASALESIARDGILYVVWYVLDDLIGASLSAPKMLTGTAQVAEAIFALLPEVQYAVKNNIAPASALNLPNTRELAKRKGSSLAIRTAKRIVELIPPV